MDIKYLIEFERRVADAWKRGDIKVPVHLSGGNEYELLRIFKDIKDSDWVISTHRNHYHYLLKGGNENALYNEILGLSSGVCGGVSGSMHTTDIPNRFVSSCLVGCGAPVAVGIALAIMLSGGRDHVWCFVGDGAVDEGWFWEALHFSEGKDLPITFVVEDNDRSVTSTKGDRGVGESMSRMSGIMLSNKVRHYSFVPTFPHVSDGTFVAF